MRRLAKLITVAKAITVIRVITTTKPTGMEHSAKIGPGMKPAVIVSVVQWHFDPPTRIRQTGGGLRVNKSLDHFDGQAVLI
jgi:hypothetical protein